jgi:hypothetical protein
MDLRSFHASPPAKIPDRKWIGNGKRVAPQGTLQIVPHT